MRKNKVNLNTEEDIKIKVVTPFLKTLGFTLDEIDFEKTFKIKFGRKKNQKIHGRSDILCRKGNINLFIIETKSDKNKLNEDDCEQAIFYAKNVDPIAFYCIITNGRETILVDSLTKEKLEEKSVNDGLINYKNQNWKISISDELNFRYEALKNFINYSKENLKLFSELQIEDRLNKLKGDKNNPEKKYIPELFVERKSLIEEFNNFLKSNYSCFALIGESGVGKTNYICGLTERYAKNNFVLFYNGFDFIDRIINLIKEDFNWIFSSTLDAPEIFRRLDSLIFNKSSKIIIFIDAIDEAFENDFENDFDNFIDKVRKFNNIKVCISCKRNDWDKFLTIRGNPTNIKENLYNSTIIKDSYFDDQNNIRKIDNIPGFLINKFSDDEMLLLEKKYKSFYSFKGNFSNSLYDTCRNGLFLRIISEVYKNNDLPSCIDTIDVFDKYINIIIEKFDNNNKESAKNYLTEIGKFLFEVKKNYIEERQLRDKLHIDINFIINPDLFSYNILYKNLNNNITYIGFYYTGIKNFIITIYFLKLHLMDNNNFKNILVNLFSNPIGQEVIIWYYNVAIEEHKKIILELQESRALLFIFEYTNIIEINFPNLIEYFEPFTRGKIGLIVTKYNFEYSFRKIEYNENVVKIVNNNIDEKKELYRYGCGIIKSKSNNFMKIDPKQHAYDEVKEQILELIENGRLNEQKNINLVIEKIINIKYFKELNLKLNKSNLEHFVLNANKVLPIDCKKELYKLQIYFYKLYFRIKDFKEKSKNIKPGDIIKLDENIIVINAKNAFEQGIEIEFEKLTDDDLYLFILLKSFKIIENKINNIEIPLLPPPDISYGEILNLINKGIIRKNIVEDIILAHYRNNQLKKYIKKFFYLFLVEYKILIETCFPTLKNQFKLYSLLPVELNLKVETKEKNDWNGLTLYFNKSKNKKDNIKIYFNPKKQISLYSIYIPCSIRLEYIFRDTRNTDKILLDQELHKDDIKEYCALRQFIYNFIKDEFESVKF